MSLLSDFFTFGGDDLPVGSVKSFLVGKAESNPSNTLITLSTDKWIVANVTYNIAEWPELFNIIRYVDASYFIPALINASYTTFYDIVYVDANTVLAAVGGSSIGEIIKSTDDGLTWSQEWGSVINGAVQTISHDGAGTIVAAGSGSNVIYSTDYGDTWTMVTPLGSDTFRGSVYGNNLFVIVGNSGALRTSTNAIEWTTESSGTTSIIYSVTYGANTYVYSGAGGLIATSTDGISWTQRNTPTTQAINKVRYANNIFLYVGNAGVLATSSDAITWDTKITSTTSVLNDVVYANSTYIAVGVGGVMLTSTDADTWTLFASNTASTITAIAGTSDTILYGVNTRIMRGNFVTAVSNKYNSATEFFVPSVQLNGTTLTPSNGAFTEAQIVSYVKAKA